ncbi:MAG TPA: ATP-binding protein [Actinomycetota bacterium]
MNVAPRPSSRVVARVARLRTWLPTGRSLDEEAWAKRHNGIRILLAAHAVGLQIFGMVRGYGALHVMAETSIVALCALVSNRPGWRRSVKEATTTFGLISASALLVHLSGGTIEAHFHFFVMVIVISLYQDWTPFLLTLAFVVVHHGVMGVLEPQSVYNHPAAWASPWRWALIHAVFVLGASAASLIAWRLNEQVRHAEQHAVSRLAATLESTADGILVVDDQGRISSFNHTFVDMWRIPQEVIDSRSDEAAIGAVLSQLQDPNGFVEKVNQLYGSDEASFDVIHFLDGRVFERYSQPQKVNGMTVGRVWSFRDITERAKLDAMRDGFLSAVSHELRTPLSAVMGYASTLQHHGDVLDPAVRQEAVERIAVGAAKLNRLLNDTLDLDRLRRGIIEPNRSPTDIGRLLRDTVEHCEVLGSRHVTVDAHDLTVSVDRAKIERIVENLLINCVRHTPPDTPIWVSAASTTRGLLLTVEDAGPGVPDEIKESVFEAFRQGKVDAHAPGVGIGLSLVARFADLHGGRAWVEDRAGGGACFRVLIPVEAGIEAGSEHPARTA